MRCKEVAHTNYKPTNKRPLSFDEMQGNALWKGNPVYNAYTVAATKRIDEAGRKTVRS